MVNYQLGKIYKITSDQTDKVYIGSTAQKYLATRLAGHVRDYDRYKNGKCNYVTSFEILKYDDHKIELIECHSCSYKEELLKREGEIMRQYDNRINRCVAGRSKKQYRKDNIEAHRKYSAKATAKWRSKNTDKVKEYKKNNKDKTNMMQRIRRQKIAEVKQLMMIDY